MKLILLGVSLMSAVVLSGCQTSDAADQDARSSFFSDTSENQSNQPNEKIAREASSTAQSSIDSIEELPAEKEAYRYRINAATSVVEPIDETIDPKVALLTFDDAPDQHAVEIAEQLKMIKRTRHFLCKRYVHSIRRRQR